MRITVLVVSLLFFGPVGITNSTLVFPHMSEEEMWMKNPSDTILNQTANMEVFVQRNIHPMDTNAVDSDLLQFPHSSVLWKVMTSVRYNRFGEDSC